MKMIDVGAKEVTTREAVAEGTVFLSQAVMKEIRDKNIKKGDVLEAAKLAGILAAKKTPDIVPLCHPIPLEYVNIEFSLSETDVRITTTVRGRAKTGVEMEALTATSAAALTIYDMCKYLDKGFTIGDIQLIKKTGGKSGTYMRRKKEK